MPVQKYRSIEEMGDEDWLEPGDPAICRRLRYLGRLTSAVRRAPAPRGVRKFGSIEEAKRESRSGD